MFDALFSLLGNGPSLLLVGGALWTWAVVTGAVFLGPYVCLPRPQAG